MSYWKKDMHKEYPMELLHSNVEYNVISFEWIFLWIIYEKLSFRLCQFIQFEIFQVYTDSFIEKRKLSLPLCDVFNLSEIIINKFTYTIK